ncbi:hypothetical protein [Allocoleopsis sp.]|uniref:hypothetical protein n=1 Tax=Allocoleopsis sp. TaxID=3088169 RepID=UPI002FD5F9E1
MSRKILSSQALDSSIYLELRDDEAETLQGGTQVYGDRIKLKRQSLPSPVLALVLLFANPFS